MPENKSRFVLLCQQVLVCGAVVAVAAPAAGVVTLDIVSPAPGQRSISEGPAAVGGSLVASEPVRPDVTEIPMTGVSASGRRALTEPQHAEGAPGASGLRLASADTLPEDVAALTAPQPVDGLGTVGVTWEHGTQMDDGTITLSVRTKKDGLWSGWQEMPYHDDHQPDPDSPDAATNRPGTDPVYVGDVDDIQVMAVTDTGTAPDGMQLALVDPGEETAPVVEKPAIDTGALPDADEPDDPSDAATAATAGTPTAGTVAADTTSTTDAADPTATDPTAPVDPTLPVDPTVPVTTDEGTLTGTPADVTPKPQIFSRAQWGADERMRDKSSLRYYEVHAGFVHHTVNANSYTKAQVPAIIRGIYAYHTQARGWSDIGYNFLVDRFGQIWEGRYGGVDRPVVGAHTLGYNDYAFAMSAIGNFETARPPAAMIDAYGRLFAWKLSLHGVDAGSRSQWVGKRYLPAIDGHRDVGQTACPGKYLYAQIPTIRDLAVKYQRPFTTRMKQSNLSGSPWPDLVVRDPATKRMQVVRTAGQLRFGNAPAARTGLGGVDLAAVIGDATGDGFADLLARDKATGTSLLYPGDGRGRFGAATVSTRRFSDLDQMVDVGDFDRDGKADLVGRRADKRLNLYPGDGNGRFRKARLLAADWSRYDATAGVGDLDGDGHVDLVARSGRDLYLVPGIGRGSLGKPVRLPGSWAGFDEITGRGDVTNDGRPDLVVRRRSNGNLFVYPGNGQGGFGLRFGPFPSFGGIDILGAAAGQVLGSFGGDVVARDRKGRIRVFVNNGGAGIEAIRTTGVRLDDANVLLNVGDWNGDGHGDVMTRSAANGGLYLLAGNGRDGFAAPVLAGKGFGSVRLLAAVGDITGDGFPDLMGQPAGGAMRIYPGNGNKGFRASYVAHSAISSDDQVGVGLWNRDGSPDTMLRRTDGSLTLFSGNGPGGLTGGVKVLTGAARYDWMHGVGDADGDGYPDLIARQRNGNLWLLPGTSSGAIGPRRFVSAGFGGYDLGG
jgi:hypothetical protein